eukprot:gene13762-11751_t
MSGFVRVGRGSGGARGGAAAAAAGAAGAAGGEPLTQASGGAGKRRRGAAGGGGREEEARWAPGEGGAGEMLASLLAFLALWAGLVAGAVRARAAKGVVYVLVLRHPQRPGAGVRVYVGAAGDDRRPRTEWGLLRGDAPIPREHADGEKVAGPLRYWHAGGWRATGEEAAPSMWAWAGAWVGVEEWLTLLLLVLLGADRVRGGAWACAGLDGRTDHNPAQWAAMWCSVRHALDACLRCGRGCRMGECMARTVHVRDGGPLAPARKEAAAAEAAL